MFSPPFRDPFNYVYDPIIVNTLDQVGAAMHTRFDVEGKPGVTTRSGSNYSTWWNGGLRTMVYFHNQVGLLTESIGNPTPETIGFVPDRVIARGDLPFPIMPQVWHFRQSIDYSITANYAVLDFAQRYRESLLYNIYVAGKNSIARGNTDNWTIYPRRIAEVKDAIAKDMKAAAGSADSRMVSGGRIATVPDKYYAIVKKPEYRDPRGYILSANEGDFLTATKFVNIMIKSGLTAHRATAPFTVAGKQYPAGSYVFKGAQPFRPHLLDMFEPQDHPNDFQYPGGPPIPPYDNAGWTLAYQMGLKFDRVLEAFDGPFEKIPDVIKPRARQGHRRRRRRRLRRQSQEQRRDHRRQSPAEGERGSVLRRRSQLSERRRHRRDLHHRQADDEGDARQGRARSRPQLHRGHLASGGRDVQADQAAHRPVGSCMAARCRRATCAGCSSSSSSTSSASSRQTLDAGNLKAKYDVLLFPDGGIPETDGGGGGFGGGGRQPTANEIPEEYRAHLGRVTIKSTCRS